MLASEKESTIDDRIGYMFRCATSRRPDSWEFDILRRRFEMASSKYGRDADAALAISGIDGSDLAAYTVVASIILNLDEVITRE